MTIENAGKVPLTGVAVDVGGGNGQIESSAISRLQGVGIKEKSTSKDYHVDIERLLPNDILRASVMTVADTADNRLEMSARSNEVRGIDATAAPGDETKDKRTLLLATVLGMLGTLIALTGAVVAFYSTRRMSFTGPSFVSNREEIITYILALSNVLPIGADTYYQNNLSYIRTGDLLLAIGLRDAQLKSKCVAALRALLDADRGMASTSADAIRDNLRRLGVEMSDADFQQLRANAANPNRDLMAARRRAATHFE